MTAADDKFYNIFPNFRKKGMVFHENRLPSDDSHEISWFDIFENGGKIWNCCRLQIIGGALWVNIFIAIVN